MAGYKERLTEDLDRWIGAGLAPGENRAAMLAMIPESRRLDAATALAIVGAILLGVAVISFIAANWEGMSRLLRFAIVLIVFAASALAAAWASHRGRQITANLLLTFAALVFAAAIGLTGQIFDIAGETRSALYTAGVAGAALAMAGRATGPMVVALIAFGIGDFESGGALWGEDAQAPWLMFFAPLGAAMALRWGSGPLAHASAIGIIIACFWFASLRDGAAPALLFLTILLGGLAWGARWLHEQGRKFASVFYGWFAWGALLLFAAVGYVEGNWGLLHRLFWLVAAGGLLALGRHDRHGLVTAIGVLGLLGAIGALLADLGLDLLAAAGLFFVAALIAMVVGLMLRGRAKA